MIAGVVNARDSAAYGKSFIVHECHARVYEVDLDKKGGAQTEVDLGDDDPEGAEVCNSCSRCGGTSADKPPSVRAGTSPTGVRLHEWPTSTFLPKFARSTLGRQLSPLPCSLSRI